MAELAKIVRVIRKRDPDAPHNTLLVPTPRPGERPVPGRIFRKIADVTGLVMTSSTARPRGRWWRWRPVRAADPCDRDRRADRGSGPDEFVTGL